MSEIKQKKRFFASHSKSSALVVSLAIHGVLVLIALSFVAVTVIQRQEKNFEYKKVFRPKQKLKKLQVPVKVKKNKPKPNLRKRVVVKNVTRKIPEFKMPEISGMKGGLGGLGDAGSMESIGFSLPEINLFGTKSKGEKIFIILDASANMLEDELGGIPSYKIIKSELVRILGGLNSAVVFNVAVYGISGRDDCHVLFPSMVPATAANVSKIQEWIEPLNVYKSGGKGGGFGTKTLGKGGKQITESFQIEPLKKEVGVWAKGALLAMKQQADVIFILTSKWGSYLSYSIDSVGKWSKNDWKKWRETVKKAKKKLAEENARRKENGKPPRIIAGHNKDEKAKNTVRAYFRGTPEPPQPTYVRYTQKELVEAFDGMRKKWKSKTKVSLSLGKKKKEKYTLNVIQFVAADGDGGTKDEEQLAKLARLTSGSYSKVEGMAAVQSYVANEGVKKKK